MPFEITREKRGAYKKFSGFVTNGEFFQSVFENQSDPDYDRMAYTINDFLEVTGYGVGTKDVERVAIFGLGAEYINARIKVAIVTLDPQIRVLVRSFTDLTHYELEFFTSVADARIWVALAQDV